MKKTLLLSAIVLGTAAASQAGVDFHIGFPLPSLPRIVISAPAPRVIVRERPAVVCAPPPVCAPAPVVCAPPPVVYVPAPRIVYAQPNVYYSYGHGREWENRRGWYHGGRH